MTSHCMMVARRDSWKSQLEKTRLANLRLAKKLASLNRRLTDYKRFVSLYQRGQINRLPQLLNVQLKRESSISAICNKVEEAIVGKYSAQGSYSTKEVDILVLVLRLGGKKLALKLVGKERRGLLPVLVVPSDKSASEAMTENAYQAAIDAWVDLELESRLGPIMDVSSDGAGVRRRQFVQYYSNTSVQDALPEVHRLLEHRSSCWT